MCSIPKKVIWSKAYSIKGFLPIFKRGFGVLFVKGFRRFPFPPAIIIESTGKCDLLSLKLSIEKEQILFYKSLVFPSLGGGTDFSSLNYSSDKKLTISFEETGEFRWDKSGSSHNYFKTIKQGGGANGRTYFFEQGGDSGSSNGGAFQTQNSQGKLLFQSDRNLVIYRPDSSVSWASGGGASSRDYKKNIF